MGFLRKLAGHILDGVGTVIEVIGEVTHIEPIADLGLSISIKGYELQDDLDLDNSSTSVQETIDVHKMCEDVRLQADTQAKRVEDAQVDKLQDDIDEFSHALSAVLPEEVVPQFQYDLQSDFGDDIHNTVADYIGSHISQDSQEFVDILKIHNKSERKQKSDTYVERIICEATDLLKSKCQNKRIQIYKKMYSDLDDYFTNVRKLSEESESNLIELQAHQNDIEFQEKQAVATIIDMAYMECIRTLTFGDVQF